MDTNNENSMSKTNHTTSNELVSINEDLSSTSGKKIKFGLKKKEVSKVNQNKVIQIEEEPSTNNCQESSEEKEITPIPMINKNR